MDSNLDIVSCSYLLEEWHLQHQVFGALLHPLQNGVNKIMCTLLILLSSITQFLISQALFWHLLALWLHWVNGLRKDLAFFTSPIWSLQLGVCCSMPHCNDCNNKEMKHQWYGKCYYTSTSSTHLTGTTKPQCPLFYSSTVPFLPYSILKSVLISVSNLITYSFVFYASHGCTNTTFTHTISPQNTLQNSISSHCFLAFHVGFLIALFVGKFLFGSLIHKGMLCGMCSWLLIRILRMSFWCFVGPDNGGGTRGLCILWGVFRMWKLKNQRLGDIDL